MIAVIIVVVASNIVATEGSESIFGASYGSIVDSNVVFNVFQKETVVGVMGSITLLALVLFFLLLVQFVWHFFVQLS